MDFVLQDIAKNIYFKIHSYGLQFDPTTIDFFCASICNSRPDLY